MVQHSLRYLSCAAADSPRLLLGFALGSVLDVQLDTSFFAMPGNRGLSPLQSNLSGSQNLCFDEVLAPRNCQRQQSWDGLPVRTFDRKLCWWLGQTWEQFDAAAICPVDMVHPIPSGLIAYAMTLDTLGGTQSERGTDD